MLANARTRLQDAADAGAYSAAILQARDHHFSACTNRSMVAKHLAVVPLVSPKSCPEDACAHQRMSKFLLDVEASTFPARKPQWDAGKSLPIESVNATCAALAPVAVTGLDRLRGPGNSLDEAGGLQDDCRDAAGIIRSTAGAHTALVNRIGPMWRDAAGASVAPAQHTLINTMKGLDVMQSMFLRTVLVTVAALVGAAAGNAQAGRYDTDLPGAADHPLISRYAGSTLYLHGGEHYGTAKVFVAGKNGAEIAQIEGRLTNRVYWAPAQRAPLEVYRNYRQALADAGFEMLYECEEARCKQDRIQNKMVRWAENMRWTGKGRSDGYIRRMFEYKPGFHYLHARKHSGDASVDVQVALRAGDNDQHSAGRVQQLVQVIESARVEGGKVSVDAAAIGASLRREGRIALYGILFDTGLAVIKPESGGTLVEMAGALKSDAALDVFIVGHTDNQGAVAGNVDLSRQRAQAVVDALVARHGIASGRLQAQGVASFAPVALNASEDGRARNRRVEMVVR